jgi:dihydroneopterin aldolase
MTNRTGPAFGRLEERAQALAEYPDRISLRDYICTVEIGAFQVERDVTQRLKFNIVVEVRPGPGDAAHDDDVDRILSYDALTGAIDTELAAERLNLLETLAERVAQRIAQEPQAMRIFVRIEKLDRGAGDLGVEIVRDGDGGAVSGGETTRPDVVLLSAEALDGADPGAWMARFSGMGRPVVLCVGAPECASAGGVHSVARKHINLLFVEQSAWRLAARYPGCLVAGSRTELDWAMAQGRLCIWAPYKMVMDAVEGPDAEAGPDMAADLVRWLAQKTGARRTVWIGGPGEAPAGFDHFSHTGPEAFE